MLYISTRIFDDKLRPQILSVGTTANSPLRHRRMGHGFRFLLPVFCVHSFSYYSWCMTSTDIVKWRKTNDYENFEKKWGVVEKRGGGGNEIHAPCACALRWSVTINVKRGKSVTISIYIYAIYYFSTLIIHVCCQHLTQVFSFLHKMILFICILNQLSTGAGS
jgi:hypothetical protein